MDPEIAIPESAVTGAINLGLDFGTYSTKLVMRARNAPNKARVVFLGEPGTEYPAFAAPSLVRLCDGKLFFGLQAKRGAGGKLFNSLKVSLLPPPPMERQGDGEFPQGTTPDLLVALYISWVLGRIKVALRQKNASLSLNIAAPMDHVENQALKERYLHVVHAAWQAAFESAAPPVTQGAQLTQLAPAFKPLLDRPIPELGRRRFEILPETLAPLVSLFRDPRSRTGLYLMIDMGAGTTELSVSRVSQPGEAGAIVCYSDNSVLLGGDQFRSNDQQNGARKEAHKVEEARLKSHVRKELHSVWYKGFTKEKDGGRAAKYQWRQLNIILAGGGLRRQGLGQMIEDASPLDAGYFLDPTDFAVDWHHPAELDFGGGRLGYCLRSPMDAPAYLAVADGLSLERQKWPKFYYSGEVEVLVREPQAVSPYERGYSQSDVG